MGHEELQLSSVGDVYVLNIWLSGRYLTDLDLRLFTLLLSLSRSLVSAFCRYYY